MPYFPTNKNHPELRAKNKGAGVGELNTKTYRRCMWNSDTYVYCTPTYIYWLLATGSQFRFVLALQKAP